MLLGRLASAAQRDAKPLFYLCLCPPNNSSMHKPAFLLPSTISLELPFHSLHHHPMYFHHRIPLQINPMSKPLHNPHLHTSLPTRFHRHTLPPKRRHTIPSTGNHITFRHHPQHRAFKLRRLQQQPQRENQSSHYKRIFRAFRVLQRSSIEIGIHKKTVLIRLLTRPSEEFIVARSNRCRVR